MPSGAQSIINYTDAISQSELDKKGIYGKYIGRKTNASSNTKRNSVRITEPSS